MHAGNLEGFRVHANCVELYKLDFVKLGNGGIDMNKKTGVLVIVLIVVLGLFAGACVPRETGVDSTKGTSTATSPSQTAQATTKEEGTKEEEYGYTLPIVKEPITLTFLKREAESAGTSFLSGRQLVWEEYEKKTGIKIKFDAVPVNEMEEIVQLRLASRQNLPDLVEIPGTQDGSYLTKYIAEGVIIPLNDYIDKYAVNMKKMFELYPDYKKSMTLPDGSLTGIGSLTATKYYTMYHMIRKDWLDRLNLSMPKTPEELVNVAKAFMSYDMNRNGQADELGFGAYGDQLKELGHAWGLHFITGAGWTVKDGKVTYEPITEEYRDFLRFLKRCVEEGVIPADWATVDKTTHNARMLNGQYGIIIRERANTIVGYQNPTGSVRKADPETDWRIIPPLEGPYGKGILVKEPIAQRWRTVNVTSANKYPAETVMWLDYVVFSEEGIIYDNYGIENLTYRRENGNIVIIPASERKMPEDSWLGTGHLPDCITDLVVETAVGPTVNYDFVNNPVIKEIKATWDIIQEPFVPPIPTVDEGRRISNLLADVKTYEDEMFYKFVSGEASLDTDWDDYVKKMKNNRMDEIIGIYQKSYDAINK